MRDGHSRPARPAQAVPDRRDRRGVGGQALPEASMPPSVLIAEEDIAIREALAHFDDIAIREALAHFLVDEGYRVQVADGREALDYAVLHHPELIVSDIKMP